MKYPKATPGMKFSRLTVVSKAPSDSNGKARWNCSCECGNNTIVDSYALRSGITKSCGCLRGDSLSSTRFIDLTGNVFGRLTVLHVSTTFKGKDIKWVCACTCGSTTEVYGSSLRKGLTKSCGCLKALRTSEAKTTHGMSRTPTHNAWCKMKERCLNNKSKDYASYGGRGIKICNRWLHSFENFYEDMGECLPKLTLDRIDVDGDYEPGNCRWETQKQQARNRRSTLFATVAGKEGKLIDIAESFGISIVGIRCYYNRHGITDMTDYLRDRLGHLYDPGLKKWLEFSEAA